MVTSPRNARRKAVTRAKIIRAANALFQERGYAATSMEDISRAGDVAIRTIYLHFESKAAVLLAYFDDWMAEVVRHVGARPAGESIDAAVERALHAMEDSGWDDDKEVGEVSALPAVLEFIGSGSPEIAGHILQRWVAAQDELTVKFRDVAGAGADPLLPRLEASAVFAAWLTAILDFRARFEATEPGDSSHAVGTRAIRAFASGLATPPGTAAARG